MSKIEVNKEEFLDKYADYVNKINSIGSELTNDCDFGVIKNSSEVVNAFVLAYQDLYFAVRKAKLVMIKDWVAFRMCIEELDIFDSYLAASLSGAPGSGNASTEMAKYLSGVLLNSSVSLETEIENIGDDCCYPEVSNVCFVTIRSDNNINLIDAIVPRLESVISGCEEYYNKIMELRSEISSVVSCKTSDNFISYMCNTQPSIVQKLMTIASEFKEDLLDYEQAYRYKLPDEGTFTLKYDELSDASEDIDSMIESLRTTLSDANTINANVSRLPSYPNVAIKPSTLGTQYAYESICDYLTNARRRLNGILEVIDETENEFINLVNEDLSSDISILKTYLDTQCDKDISSVCFTAVNFTSRYTLPNYEELSALSGIRNEEDLYVDESNGFDYYFNRLYDENGDLIDANYEDFKEYLNRMGVDSSIVDNDMLAGINIYMSHLESLGYSRETAQQIVRSLIVENALSLTNLDHVPYDAQQAIFSHLDETSYEWCLNTVISNMGLRADGEDTYITRFWDIFNINASQQDIMDLMTFYSLDPNSMSLSEYRQRQIDAMMLLADLTEGYTEDPGNVTIFGDWYGYHTFWCGEYVSWLLSAVGLAGENTNSIGALNTNDGVLTVDNIQTWGSTAYNFGNSSSSRFGSDRYYTFNELNSEDCDFFPQPGDIVITTGSDGDGHVCMVYSTDIENGTFVTIDGNSGSMVAIRDGKSLSDKSLVGIVDIHSV